MELLESARISTLSSRRSGASLHHLSKIVKKQTTITGILHYSLLIIFIVKVINYVHLNLYHF